MLLTRPDLLCYLLLVKPVVSSSVSRDAQYAMLEAIAKVNLRGKKSHLRPQ